MPDQVSLLVVGVMLAVGAGVVLFRVPEAGRTVAPNLRMIAYRDGIPPTVGVAAGVLLVVVPACSLAVAGFDVPVVGWGLLAGIYVGGVLFATTGIVARPRAVALQRAESTPAGEATGGRVVVSGTVRPATGPVTSPFDGSTAVCMLYSIEVRGEGSDRWFQTDFGQVRTAFYVEDESGHVLVDPTDAWLKFPSRADARRTDRELPSPEVAETVVQAGERFPDAVREFCVERDTRCGPADGEFADCDVRFRGWLLRPGDEVVVLGQAREGRSPDGRATTVLSGDSPRDFVVTTIPEPLFREGLLAAADRHLTFGVPLAVLSAAGMFGLPFVL